MSKRGMRQSGELAPLPPAVDPNQEIAWELEQIEKLEDFDTVIGDGGRFIKVPTIFGTALVKDTRKTREITPVVQQSALKIPGRLFEATRDLFKYIYEQQKTEAVVLFYYNKNTTEWQTVIPSQKCSGGQASYDLSVGRILNLETGEEADIDNTKGWVLAGSAHSHGMMGAFWSGGDNINELPINGFHVTFGKVLDPIPALACSLVVRHTRFVLPAHQVFDIEPIEYYKPHQSVLDQVVKDTYKAATVTKGAPAPVGGPNSAWLPKGAPAAADYGSHRGSQASEDADWDRAWAGARAPLSPGEEDAIDARLRRQYPHLYEGEDLPLDDLPIDPRDIALLAELEQQDAGITEPATESTWARLVNK